MEEEQAVSENLGGSNEPLSRSIHQSRHYKKGLIALLFMPNKKGLTSLIRTQGMSEDEIWAKCTEVAKTRSPPKLYGRADMSASNVKEVGLGLDRDRIDHANITGWSALSEEDQLEKAGLLAQKAAFVPHPGGTQAGELGS